mgnify:CR=1|tara:strand:- start:464 stop:838 length:375 start_codon:yes stop_codon:yes gene_type:complete
MKRTVIIIGILFLMINSCKGDKNDSSNFIFKNKNQKIELKILNGNDYLIAGNPTKVDFILTNIDPKTTFIFGRGILILESKNGITKTEINVPNNYIKTSTLDVQVRFKDGDKISIAKFRVPVRN